MYVCNMPHKIKVLGGKRVKVQTPSGRKVELKDFEPLIDRVLKRMEKSKKSF